MSQFSKKLLAYMKDVLAKHKHDAYDQRPHWELTAAELEKREVNRLARRQEGRQKKQRLAEQVSGWGFELAHKVARRHQQRLDRRAAHAHAVSQSARGRVSSALRKLDKAGKAGTKAK